MKLALLLVAAFGVGYSGGGALQAWLLDRDQDKAVGFGICFVAILSALLYTTG
jgi:hypothetical protein